MPRYINLQLQLDYLLLDRFIYLNPYSHFLQRAMLDPKCLHNPNNPAIAHNDDYLHNCDDVPCDIYVQLQFNDVLLDGTNHLDSHSHYL